MTWDGVRLGRDIKATLRYKVRLERMENTRIARKVYLWNLRSSKWEKKCMDMVDRSEVACWLCGCIDFLKGENACINGR